MLYQSITWKQVNVKYSKKNLAYDQNELKWGQEKGGGTHKFTMRREPASVRTQRRIASPLHAKITDVSKGLF